MLNFLAYSPHDIRQCDAIVAMQAVDAFIQKKETGLIEVEWPSAKYAIILLSDGQLVGVNILEKNICKKITLELLPSFFHESGAKLRSVRASREAVRAVLMALDWYPPNRVYSLQTNELQAQLEVGKAHHYSGLFHLVGKELDGYIFLLDGEHILEETLLCKASDSVIGKHAYGQLLAYSAPDLSLEVYEAGMTSAAYHLISFRCAFAQFLHGMFNRYARLVGADMAATLAASMNQLLGERNYQLSIVQNQFFDTHVFVSPGAVYQAYRFLFKNLTEQMGEMIGVGLAHSISFEVFRSMSPEKQAVLRESPLLVMIISPR